MSWHSKVIWSQGMFLLPHHFQQETRYLEHLVDSRVRSLATHGWGFTSLELDEALLAVGRLGLIRARQDRRVSSAAAISARRVLRSLRRLVRASRRSWALVPSISIRRLRSRPLADSICWSESRTLAS